MTDLTGGMGLRLEEGGEIRAPSLSFVKDKAVFTAEQEDCNLASHIGLNGEPAIQKFNGRTYASARYRSSHAASISQTERTSA